MTTSKGNKTRENIKLAMLRVKHNRPINKELVTRLKNKKLEYSISAVALEAGIKPASIHNNYSDLAEKIRKESGKDTRNVVSKKNSEIKELKAKNKSLRRESEGKNRDISKLASINLRLQKEIERLESIQNNKNVLPLVKRDG